MVNAIEAAVVRKASWRILPLLGLGYGAAYMDRINIGFAALRMNADLHFSATVYGLGAGLFFLAYAAFEVPSNMLLTRFGARRWMARIMLTWGILASAMMFVRTPMEFYVMRFLLGLAEAGFFPGVIYYLTLWFPLAHRGRAISRFYVAWPISSLIMGAVAGTLLGLNGTLGLAGWQWLFLIEGLPAIALSAVFLFALPDSPEKAPWLSATETTWLAARLAADQPAPADHSLWRVLRQGPMLALGLANLLILGSFYAFNLSAPVYLAGATGLSAAKVGYVIAASGLLGAIAMLSAGWVSDRTGERYWHMAIPLALMAVAFAVMSQTHAPPVVVGAFWAVAMCNAAVGAIFWTAPAPFLTPRSAALGLAAINCVGQSGSFFLPWAWGVARDQTGSFQAGLTALPIGFLIAAGLVLYLKGRARRVAVTAVTA
jgi:ACS family tartrate transporter-like MFS transporter